MNPVKYIEALFRLGGNTPKCNWLKSTRGSSHHTKIVHAFVPYTRHLSLCGDQWWSDCFPFVWFGRPHRVCTECAGLVLEDLLALRERLKLTT